MPYGAIEITGTPPRLRSGARFATSSRLQRQGASAPAGVVHRLGRRSLAARRQALARDTGGEVIYDWGGGLIWAAPPQKPDAQAQLVRSRVEPPVATPA